MLGPEPRWVSRTARYVCLGQPDHALRQRVVVRIPGAADRRLDAGLGQPLRIPNRQVLHAPIAVMHQWFLRNDPAIVERLLQRIEGQVAAQRGRRPPADDPTREHVDDGRHVHESAPRGHVRRVGDPQLVRPRGLNCRVTRSGGRAAAVPGIIVTATFSRSSYLICARSSVVSPGRRPPSRSACRTQLRSVSAAHDVLVLSRTGASDRPGAVLEYDRDPSGMVVAPDASGNVDDEAFDRRDGRGPGDGGQRGRGQCLV